MRNSKNSDACAKIAVLEICSEKNSRDSVVVGSAGGGYLMTKVC